MAGSRQIVEMIAKRLSLQGFDKVLSKAKVISGGDGCCVVELKVEEEHKNIQGTLHGGMTATMVDVFSTLAMMTHEKSPPPGVTVDLHVSYLKGAKVGDTVIVEASTLKAGKNLAYLHADIKDKITNDLLARGSHIKYIGS